MRNYLLFSIIILTLAGCEPIPQIPNLTVDSLRGIPPKHRKIIAKIAEDHKDYCYFRLGQKFSELGDEAFGNGFIIAEGSIETLRISRLRKASLLYQNFTCDKQNEWRATSSKKVFIIVADKVFQAWISGAISTVKQGNLTTIIFPQDKILCQDDRGTDVCEFELYWDDNRSEFVTIKGPMILEPYSGAFK